jgi:hypothetical protein
MKINTYIGTFQLLDRVTYTDSVETNNRLFAFILLKLRNDSKLLKLTKIIK